MYEAVLSEDAKYNIPDTLTSRAAEVLQVYLKSLGIRIKTIVDDSEFIAEEEHTEEIIGYEIKNSTIFCTAVEKYHLDKLTKVYKRYRKECGSDIIDTDDAWEYCVEHLPFKKKKLTENIIKLFKDNLEAFTS